MKHFRSSRIYNFNKRTHATKKCIRQSGCMESAALPLLCSRTCCCCRRRAPRVGIRSRIALLGCSLLRLFERIPLRIAVVRNSEWVICPRSLPHERDIGPRFAPCCIPDRALATLVHLGGRQSPAAPLAIYALSNHRCANYRRIRVEYDLVGKTLKART